MTEGPYKLPQGWRWVRLGEVCLPTERRDPTKDPSAPFIYVDISAVDNAEGKIVSPRELLGQDAPSRARKVIRSGDVIFATTRPYLKNVAMVGPELDGQLCSTGFCVLRANPSVVEPGLLFYLCRSDLVVAQLSGNNMRGASYPAVTDRDVYEALAPLPPLSEQRRIVARIEELMARVRKARRLRQQAREDAERLWQSVLAETFPRPGSDLPQGWRWVRLGEVCEHLRSSIDPRRYPDEEFYLYSFAAYDSGLRPERVKGSQIGSTKLLIDGGVCLFSKLNPRIPRAWVVRNSNPSLRRLASTEFMPLNPIYPLLDLDFLGIVLLTKAFLDQVRRDVSGATGSRQRLKPKVVLSAFIPLPPLSEQRRIVAHLEEVREHMQALKKTQEETEARLKDLERSILDKAFRGEL